MPDGNWYEQMYGQRDARLLPLEPGHVQFLADPAAPQSGNLLDAGCGTGNFLLAAKAAGFEVTGTELDPAAIRFIQSELKIDDVFPLTITEFARTHSERKFSTITFFEVLEHQADPVSFLCAVKSCLRPRAYVALSVPNRNRWLTAPDVLDYPPNHFLRWSPLSLRNFLTAQGFELLALREQPVGLGYAAQMINSFFRTGLSRTVAGSVPPAFREVMQMAPADAAVTLAAKPTARQRIFLVLSLLKRSACYPLALFVWPVMRLMRRKGLYLYALARRMD